MEIEKRVTLDEMMLVDRDLSEFRIKRFFQVKRTTKSGEKLSEFFTNEDVARAFVNLHNLVSKDTVVLNAPQPVFFLTKDGKSGKIVFIPNVEAFTGESIIESIEDLRRGIINLPESASPQQ